MQISFFLENYLSRPCPEGPWTAVVKVPKVFSQVDPAYFKTVKKAGEAPAAMGYTPPPKAKIIVIPPTAPPDQAPHTIFPISSHLLHPSPSSRLLVAPSHKSTAR
jgi:hypothetical protein